MNRLSFFSFVSRQECHEFVHYRIGFCREKEHGGNNIIRSFRYGNDNFFNPADADVLHIGQILCTAIVAPQISQNLFPAGMSALLFFPLRSNRFTH
jgi:hypothetical protein